VFHKNSLVLHSSHFLLVASYFPSRLLRIQQVLLECHCRFRASSCTSPTARRKTPAAGPPSAHLPAPDPHRRSGGCSSGEGGGGSGWLVRGPAASNRDCPRGVRDSHRPWGLWGGGEEWGLGGLPAAGLASADPESGHPMRKMNRMGIIDEGCGRHGSYPSVANFFVDACKDTNVSLSVILLSSFPPTTYKPCLFDFAYTGCFASFHLEGALDTAF